MPSASVSQSDQQEFSDADLRIVAKADQSKKLAFDASRLTTATTRTQTVPDVSGVIGLDEAGITTVASATSTPIGASKTRDVSITGTTTITSFDTVAAGTYRQGAFTGILTFTHNATSLILPGAANITTAAGDTFGAISLGSGNWRVLWYQKASGAAVVAPAGGGMTLLGTVTTTSGSTATLSGLTLTSYLRLFIVVNGISSTSNSTLTINSQVALAALVSAANNWKGWIDIDLTTGAAKGTGYVATNTDTSGTSIPSGLSTASTSVTLGVSVGTFDAGSFTVYGVK